MPTFLILTSTAILVIGFQNCANSANFSSTDELMAKPVLAMSDSTDSVPVGGGSDVLDPIDQPVSYPPVTDAPVATIPPVATLPPVSTVPPVNLPPMIGEPTPGDDPVLYPPVTDVPAPTSPPVASLPPVKLPPIVEEPTPIDEPVSYPPITDISAPDDDQKDARSFVCVLEGNGKSVKLALVGKTLQGKVGTARDVCMTEKSCLTIVSKKFAVKSAERRGFCPDKNPSVVSMSGLEIEAALVHAELVSTMPNQAKK